MIRDEFKDIIGHNNLLEYLSKKIESKSMSNIILLIGLQGIGKTSIAKRIAICLNENNDSEEDIKQGVDTENVKFFNMSVLRSDEELRRVCANFTKPINGNKILILDECHGMTLEQQDSILTQLEQLPDNLYIIFCTTELTRMREALQSRIKAVFKLNNLSRADLSMLCKKLIMENKVVYNGRTDSLVSRLCKYADGDARKLHNCINEIKTLIPVEESDLDTLIGKDTFIVPLMLVEMLETSILQGLNFINNLIIDYNFKSSCNTLLSVLCGSTSVSVSKIESEKINRLNKLNYNLYCDFLCSILGENNLDTAKLVSIFYTYNKKINSKAIDITIDSTDKVVSLAPADDEFEKLAGRDNINIDNLLEVTK